MTASHLLVSDYALADSVIAPTASAMLMPQPVEEQPSASVAAHVHAVPIEADAPAQHTDDAARHTTDGDTPQVCLAQQFALSRQRLVCSFCICTRVGHMCKVHNDAQSAGKPSDAPLTDCSQILPPQHVHSMTWHAATICCTRGLGSYARSIFW